MSLKSFQVTMTGGTDAVLPSGDLFCKFILFVDNAAANTTLGTAALCTIPCNTGGGNYYQGWSGPGLLNLAGWYCKGTNTQKLDVFYDAGD